MIDLAILILSIVPQPEIARSSVDEVELHHFYSEAGEHTWSQVIFWDWDDDLAMFVAVSYRMVRDGKPSVRRDGVGGGYVVVWMDEHLLRAVRSKSFKESWLQFDPEVDNRDITPVNLRKGLPVPVLRKTGK